MNAWVLMLLPTALGVDFGWERQPDNSIEYIVQIEPEAVDEMKTGTELISSLPPQLRNIRNYRIRVGRERLPNQNILPPEVTTNSTAATNPAPATTAWGNSTQANNYQPNGSRQRFPPNGSWRLRPFEAPRVPVAGEYEIVYSDSDLQDLKKGGKISIGPQFSSRKR